MRFVLLSAILSVTLIACSQAPTVGYAYRNGLWYDGIGFEASDRYAVDGVLTVRAPDSIARTFDLGGGFAIPALGDAHTHLFDDPAVVADVRRAFVERGVLFAKSLNNSAAGRAGAASAWDSAGLISLSFANGGVTATLGHPALLYETLATQIYFARTPEERASLLESRLMDGDGYHVVDRREDWPASWQALHESEPDFVKIYSTLR